MNRNLASILTITTTTAAAILAVAAMTSGTAYADDITVDNTPFVSTKTRAEVRAEVMGQAEALRTASSEWSMNQHVPAPERLHERASKGRLHRFAQRSACAHRGRQRLVLPGTAAAPHEHRRHPGGFGAVSRSGVRPRPPPKRWGRITIQDNDGAERAVWDEIVL